jgi:hypothetical protein
MFARDGKTLAGWIESTRRVYLWDMEAGGDAKDRQIDHDGGVLAVAFSADCRTMATGGGDEKVRLWDLTTGAPLGVLDGHTGPINRLTFSLDNKTLVSKSLDRTVILWDVAMKKEIYNLRGKKGDPVHVLAPFKGNTFMAYNAGETGGQLRDMNCGKELGRIAVNLMEMTNWKVSRDNQTLAMRTKEGLVRRYDLTKIVETAKD